MISLFQGNEQEKRAIKRAIEAELGRMRGTRRLLACTCRLSWKQDHFSFSNKMLFISYSCENTVALKALRGIICSVPQVACTFLMYSRKKREKYIYYCTLLVKNMPRNGQFSAFSSPANSSELSCAFSGLTLYTVNILYFFLVFTLMPK